ncbi:MAG: SPOR domain-containing protein [Dysgonamonadaceae bacterium]|jgi:cell division septation protein DedD|nr:SPOR domain-containing protein [Dysgonamonadaceae bacterium]
MKTKLYLIGLSLSLLTVFYSCKSKESAYKAAYEAAKQKEIEPIDEVIPVQKPQSSSSVSVQREKVTVLDGTIKQFSVVIGSFANKTNAVSLKSRMEKDGYVVYLAQNSREMYRVIVATFDDKASAAAERDSIKDRYYPNFQDAWILDNN